MTTDMYRKVRWAIGAIASIVMIGSLALGYLALDDVSTRLRDSAGKDLGLAPVSQWSVYKEAEVVVLLFWVLGPPVWFWFEYFFFYRLLPKHQSALPLAPHPDSLDAFKYGQDLASKIWLAGSTALFLLYFGKDLR